MLRHAFSICCITAAICVSAGNVRAQSCPEYFRFVDFGLMDADEKLHSGGATFKVKREGMPLFENGSVVCRDIAPVFTDGHNQPIPLVTSFKYEPTLVARNLTDLSITRATNTLVNDVPTVAQRHRKARNKAGVDVMKGSDFLCVTGEAASPRTISCEVVNPFDTTTSFFVACTGKTCAMSGMAIDDAIMVSGGWSSSENASEKATGEVASEIAGKIHTFIKDKTAH